MRNCNSGNLLANRNVGIHTDKHVHRHKKKIYIYVRKGFVEAYYFSNKISKSKT